MVTFPTLQTCDLDDPQEMFLPLLVGLPVGEYHIAFPVMYLRLVSQRFHELGAFMKCPDCGLVREPAKVWRPPSSSTPHWLSDPGEWEKTGTPRPKSSKFDSVIPTREQCDLDDPREMFAWMFAGLPGMNGAPMLFDGGWAMDASEHLFDGGAMLKCVCGYSKTPEKEYVAPSLTGAHWLTSPGEWVPHGTKPARTLEAEIDASLAKMALRQQAELKAALEADRDGRELPDSPAGQVVAGMPDHLKVAVLKRLQET